MKQNLDGIWVGVGEQVYVIYTIPKNLVYKIKLGITMTFVKVGENVYSVSEVLRVLEAINVNGTIYQAGDIYTKTNYLIYTNGEKKFISENPSGMGINWFDFNCSGLNFSYNVNIPAEISTLEEIFPVQTVEQSLVGQFKLKKTDC